ncbi:hypothetical protein HD554DRAFT_2037104 [Boletus coccyginus]|nr:hypothetical protein HD554DRAFT_2037104 [Boletus coccyginus]
MNPSYSIQPAVMLAMAHAELLKPSMSSPHPRLFESLKTMFLFHYSGGITVNMLCFDQIYFLNLKEYHVVEGAAGIGISVKATNVEKEDTVERGHPNAEPAIRPVNCDGNSGSCNMTSFREKASMVPLNARNTTIVPTYELQETCDETRRQRSESTSVKEEIASKVKFVIYASCVGPYLLADMNQRWKEEQEWFVTNITNMQLQITKLKKEVAKLQ